MDWGSLYNENSIHTLSERSQLESLDSNIITYKNYTWFVLLQNLKLKNNKSLNLKLRSRTLIKILDFLLNNNYWIENNFYNIFRMFEHYVIMINLLDLYENKITSNDIRFLQIISPFPLFNLFYYFLELPLLKKNIIFHQRLAHHRHNHISSSLVTITSTNMRWVSILNFC